jgi:hypothetical protein
MQISLLLADAKVAQVLCPRGHELMLCVPAAAAVEDAAVSCQE